MSSHLHSHRTDLRGLPSVENDHRLSLKTVTVGVRFWKTTLWLTASAVSRLYEMVKGYGYTGGGATIGGGIGGVGGIG